MDPKTLIAENHTRISRRLFNEGMRAVENKSYKKEIKKLVLIFAALFLILAIWLVYTGTPLVFLLGEALFLAMILIWISVMLPDTKRRSKYKALQHNSGSTPERTILFYPDRLSVTANSGEVTLIPYTEITELQETRNLYIFHCSQNTSLLIAKNGFVLGDFHAVKRNWSANL